MLAVLLLFALGTLRAQQIEEGADAPPRGAGVHTLVDRFGYPWFPDPAIVARLSDAASDPAVADCSGFTL